MIKAMVSTLLL